MKFSPITFNDLRNISHLQPEGWTSIGASITYYVNASFCYPVKVVVDNFIVGIGALIVYGETAWLAHIIVDKEFRGRGIGKAIVKHLINHRQVKDCNSLSLIATDLGKPIYEKVGFKVETEYKVFKKQQIYGKVDMPSELIPLKESHLEELIKLDSFVSGEKREQLIRDHLNGAYIVLSNNKLEAYYLSSLGEGFIGAINNNVGLLCLDYHTKSHNKIVLPEDNHYACTFLTEHKYECVANFSRMYLRKELSWDPRCIYSRIGGNFG